MRLSKFYMEVIFACENGQQPTGCACALRRIASGRPLRFAHRSVAPVGHLVASDNFHQTALRARLQERGLKIKQRSPT